MKSPEDDEYDEVEMEEMVICGFMKEIVSDTEYGVVSVIFEFTILNDDM